MKCEQHRITEDDMQQLNNMAEVRKVNEKLFKEDLIHEEASKKEAEIEFPEWLKEDDKFENNTLIKYEN